MADSARFEACLKQLPVMPEVATKVMGMAEGGRDVSFRELENIIRVDPGLTAKILKVANSAMYARQREVSTLQAAITLLGFNNIRSLVLLVTASGLFQTLRRSAFYRTFWRHAVHTAFLGRHLSTRVGQKELADTSFLGGLLHDIGQAAFYNGERERYEALLAGCGPGLAVLQAEKAQYGFDHRELGAVLLDRWFFPEVYVHCAREHGNLSIDSRHKTVILLVSMADSLAASLGWGMGETYPPEAAAAIQKALALAETDLAYYRERFAADIEADDLYRQCGELFGLQKP